MKKTQNRDDQRIPWKSKADMDRSQSRQSVFPKPCLAAGGPQEGKSTNETQQTPGHGLCTKEGGALPWMCKSRDASQGLVFCGLPQVGSLCGN